MTVSGSGQSITRETNCDVPLLSPATVHSQLVSAVNCRNPINMIINCREGLKHTGHMGHLGVCLNLQPNSIVFCTEYNCTITSQWCNKINKAVKYLIQISIFFVDSKYMIVSKGINKTRSQECRHSPRSASPSLSLDLLSDFLQQFSLYSLLLSDPLLPLCILLSHLVSVHC